MKIALPIIILVLFLSLLYMVALKGRNNHRGLTAIKKSLYAHRGLHRSPDIPENSLSAFKLAIAKGYGCELDVHLLRDGGLAVFHDSTLNRMTGENGNIYDLGENDLKNYKLNGTSDTIPLFSEVLALFENKAPLIIELKTDKNNAVALCEAVFKLLDSYKGIYCVESFDPRVLMWLRKNRPDVIRGQLCQNFLKDTSKMVKIIDLILTSLILNFLTRPDFIAYKFKDRSNLANLICLKLWKIQGVSWTLRNKQDLHTALNENLIPIFENFEPTL
ncbi:MAG: glycerophosphodiester phosphodiesterase [Clostridia bacterium]|nr:glycerophosphodiester phosphodiesterase [Clostridia bacterium]